jgi:RNA polymerase sigma-70 factor, ECF subfamily
MTLPSLIMSLLGFALPIFGVTTTTHAPVARFDDIYQTHFAFVWRSVRRLGVPERFIDDATQDVFVVVHRKLADFEGRSSIKTWLFGIALRVSKDYRDRARRYAVPETETVEVASDGASAHDLLEQKQAAQMLDMLLESIEEERRPVFILAELESTPAPEIAVLLGIPLNTVYSRLRLARSDFEKAVSRQIKRQP